ncbi:MAG: hypothetical protein PSX80_07290 [bacterium]|nr:hypothetical protein [bacterium]
MKVHLLIASLLALFAVSAVHAQAESTSGKVFWRGSVDNKVHLTIKGDTLEQKAIEGTEKAPGKFSFTAPLPDQAVIVKVLRKEGRSKKIKVIQQPTADNDFTAVVEIHDDGGGSRDYVLEIFW